MQNAFGSGGSKGRSISKKDYKILKQVFIAYDKDGSGTVTYQEFLKVLCDRTSGGTKDLQSAVLSAAGMFDMVDQDGDGEMRFEELLNHCYPSCSAEEILKFMNKYDPAPVIVEKVKKELTEDQEDELCGVMMLFDKDGDAEVNIHELRLYCSNLGIDDETIQQWFAKYDLDSDGSLDKAEFFEFFREVW